MKLAYCDYIADRIQKLLDREVGDNDTLISNVGKVQMDLHPTEGWGEHYNAERGRLGGGCCLRQRPQPPWGTERSVRLPTPPTPFPCSAGRPRGDWQGGGCG